MNEDISFKDEMNCKFCGIKFKFSSQLVEHYNEFHNYCKVCDRTFGDRFDMLEHLEQSHKINTQCQFCTFTKY